jgi:hypothetical protein
VGAPAPECSGLSAPPDPARSPKVAAKSAVPRPTPSIQTISFIATPEGTYPSGTTSETALVVAIRASTAPQLTTATSAPTSQTGPPTP